MFSSRYAPGFTVRSGHPHVLILPAEYFEDGYDEAQAVRFAEGRTRVWYLATDTPQSDTPPDVQAHEYRPEQRLIADGFPHRGADRCPRGPRQPAGPSPEMSRSAHTKEWTSR